MSTPNWIAAVADGADPTGARDSTAAIRTALRKAAASITTRGSASVVYLPTGPTRPLPPLSSRLA